MIMRLHLERDDSSRLLTKERTGSIPTHTPPVDEGEVQVKDDCEILPLFVTLTSSDAAADEDSSSSIMLPYYDETLRKKDKPQKVRKDGGLRTKAIFSSMLPCRCRSVITSSSELFRSVAGPVIIHIQLVVLELTCAVPFDCAVVT